jgi:hypothetical protein
MYIRNKGNPDSLCWVVIDKPLSDDKDKRFLYSAPLGYVFDKMMKDAGIYDYYVISFRPETDDDQAYQNVIGSLNQFKPPIIIPLGAIGQKLLPELALTRRGKNYNEDKDSELSKYAGSLLSSPKLTYPAFVIPSYEPLEIVRQWKMRDVIVSCDLSKAAAEIEWYKNHENTLQPLPQQRIRINFDDFGELLATLDSFLNFPLLSNDIETLYPRAPTKTQPSQFYKILPGYPVTIGLAPGADFGISFDFFRKSTIETRELWKHLAKLLWEVPSLGQNFFNFDACFYEMLGFRLPLDKCRDTLILHHLLWPELKHTLAFQTRQYTRNPYYKEIAQGWTPEKMDTLKWYNAQDCVVTYEIYEAQLAEMKARGLE